MSKETEKKLVYFYEFDGMFILMESLEDLAHHLEINLEEDDQVLIKAKYMTQEEIDDLPQEGQ